MAGWQPDLVLFTEDINERGRQTVEHFRKLGVEVFGCGTTCDASRQ